MKTSFHTILFLSALLALTACQSPLVEQSDSGGNGADIRETSQLKPPAPPVGSEEVQPEIAPEPEPAPPPELPEGIALKVDGKSVSLDQLRAGSYPEDTTVQVQVRPDTTYEKVVEVLDKIHAMGFLIALSAGE